MENWKIILVSSFALLIIILFLWQSRRKTKQKEKESTTSPQMPQSTGGDTIREYSLEAYEELILDKQKIKNLLELEIEEKRKDLTSIESQINIERRTLDEVTEEKNKNNAIINSLMIQKDNISIDLDRLKMQYEEEKDKLDNLIYSIQSIINERKRKALEENFYKVNINEATRRKIFEIENFSNQFPEIKNAITSAVYNHYYAAEVSSMCNRVLGNKRITGVYKITNSVNGLVYVGQSVDIKNRWTQHIKRAVGVEKETQNLLYPAMREFGVWNFSFEVLEKCLKEDLTTREKFYQGVYKAKEDYSIK